MTSFTRAQLDPVSVDGTIRRATTYAYDALGRKLREDVAEVTDSSEADIVAAVTGGVSDAVVDPGGRRSYAYSPNGWLLTETGRNSETINHTFAANGQELTVTDSTSSAVVTNTWFLNGWQRSSGTTQPGLDGSFTAFRYYGDGLPAAQSFDDNGAFSSIEAFQAYAYNDARELTSVVNLGWNQNFDSWAYSHDQAGRTTSIAHPDAVDETFALSTDGTVLSATVSKGGTYDANGRVTLESTPASGPDGSARWQTRTTWTADGLVASVVERSSTASTDEHERTMTYDADGNPEVVTTKVSASTSDVETSTYYADGLVHELTAGPATTRYVYDANGNPAQVWSPSAVASSENNDGTPTINLYTHDNLLAAVIDPVAVDGTTRRATTFAYDAAGRRLREDVAEVTDSDPAEILAAVTGDPSTAVVESGGRRSYEYSRNGWLMAEHGRNGETISSTYAANGQPLTVTDSTSAAVVTNTWFLNGWQRSSGTQLGADGTHTAFRYYGDGRRAAQSFDDDPAFPSVEAFQAYAYNDARVPTSVVNFGWGQNFETWTFSHDRAGRPTGVDHPDGIDEAWTWAADGTLSTATVENSSGLLDSWEYDYDDRNRVTERSRSGPAGGAVRYDYTYDEAGRLDDYTTDTNPSDQTPGAVTVVDHDPNGNRTQFGADSYDYRADNSILDRNDGPEYQYDARGALLDDDCATSTYDGFDRIASTSGGGSNCDGDATTYAYDGLGRQVRTTDDETTALRYVGTTSTLWAEHTDSNETNRYITDAGGYALALVSGSTQTIQHLHTDGQGNTTLLTDGGGAIDCATNYDPWGGSDSLTSGTACDDTITTNSIWYRGARRDASSGNYQFGERTYNPGSASWLTPDSGATSGGPTDLSIGVDPLTANRYSYVNGDPINLFDPSGHDPDTAAAVRERLKNQGEVRRTITVEDETYELTDEEAVALNVELGGASTCPIGPQGQVLVVGPEGGCGFWYTEHDDGWRQQVANAAGGVLDAITFGQSDRLLSLLNLEDRVDRSSAAFKGAQIVATVVDLLAGVGAVVKALRALKAARAAAAVTSLTDEVVPLLDDLVGAGASAADDVAGGAGSLVDDAAGAGPGTAGSGPVTFRPPPGATADEIAQVRAYVDGCNAALCAGQLSPTGRVSTQGALRADASRAATAERARAAAAGSPYSGHAGHVPDTTWTGSATPSSWLDLTARVNTSLGGQSVHYPIGYRPTVFELLEGL